jgi:DNA-binding NarL/FixJ family response regulator
MMAKPPAAIDVPPPPDLRATHFAVGDGAYVILSFAVPHGDDSLLTPAEADIAGALVQGKSNRRIAAERGRSVHTIVNQVSAIFRKLGVRSRAELVARFTRDDRSSRGGA